MTTINLREPAEQALKAMRCAVPTGTITLYEWDKAMAELDAALAQQAEPHRDLRAALQAPGCERLREWVEIGPVQRAALETFAAELRRPAAVEAQRDALLEALKEVVAFTGAHGGPYAKARAAIKAVKGEKT